MINETTNQHCHSYKGVCWSAILVGALVGIGLGFLLNLFGLAIGLSAFHTSADGTMVLAIGGMIGTVIGVIVSMFISGYTAGYLGHRHFPQRNMGLIYGFTTWTVALLLSGFVTAQMASYLGTYSSGVSNAVFVLQTNKAAPVNTVVVKKSSDKKSENTVQVTAPAVSLTCAAFCIFFLFFIGAFSSCLGAGCAMSCRRED